MAPPASRGRIRRVGRFAAAALLALGLAPARAAEPLRGDLDQDGMLNITDAVNILGFLFLTNAAPYCAPVADANDDGVLNITDALQVLNYLFLAGPPLPELNDEEFRDCGGQNLPPSLPSRPIYHAYQGFPVALPIAAVDPEGDELHYEARPLPAGATLDPAAGILRWTPGASVLGTVYVPVAVTDEGRPPNRVEGRLVFYVRAVDPCNRPRCDPALGCEDNLMSLSSDCCGDPAARAPDPELDCPEGAILHVGRNALAAPTIGRLQNCDRLRLAVAPQGGFEARLSFEARCIDPVGVTIRARVATAAAVLIDQQMVRNLEAGSGGFYDAKFLSFPTERSYPEEAEAELTVNLEDRDGVRLERKVRVVLTRLRLDDLP